MSSPMRTYITINKSKFNRVAFCCTQGLCPIMRTELFFLRFRADTFVKRGVIDSTIYDASSGPGNENKKLFGDMQAPCGRHPISALALRAAVVKNEEYEEMLRQFAGALQMQSDPNAATTSEDR